jgi:IS5 family transposase
MGNKGLFDEDERLQMLIKLGDPLIKIDGQIDWEGFRPLLESAFKKERQKGKGGRPAYDDILMFKILILQQLYNIADEKTEYQINDRLSFQRFIGLRLNDKVPDAKTIWLYRERLVSEGMADKVFEMFEKRLEEKGIITRQGSIVDATFVDAPKQRNNREENKAVKSGETPENWKLPEKIKPEEMTAEQKKLTHKLRQKDIDARWTKKNDETHYGYKDHAKVDKDSKLIVDHEVTNAAVHDSQKINDLIDEQDKECWADAGYVGEQIEKDILKKNPEIALHINEKGFRNHPLSDEQKKNNQEKSKIRCRVEHVFGDMTNSMGGLTIRCIGMARAKCVIALKDLAYNMKRYVYLVGAAA